MASPKQFLIFGLELKSYRSKATFLPHFSPLGKSEKYPFERLHLRFGSEIQKLPQRRHFYPHELSTAASYAHGQ